MRTGMSILLCILIAVSFCACNSTEDDTIVSPVSFFYCKNEIVYDSENGVIGSEIRDAAPYENELVQLMNIYLKGPVSESLYSPFPSNGKAVHLSVNEDNVHIILDSSFASLSGIDLTLARLCIANTLIGLTQVDAVQISVENDSSGSRQTVTVRPDSYIFENSNIVINQSED